MKKCPRCVFPKPLDEFYNSKRRKDGKSTYCKVHDDERILDYLTRNPPVAGKRAQRDHRYYLRHKEDKQRRYKAWRKANPIKASGITRRACARRRARKHNDPFNDITEMQWQEILNNFNHRCAYCAPNCSLCRKKKHKLEPDHITSIAHGGSNTLHKIVPACRYHNNKKNAGPVLNPVQPLLLTVATPLTVTRHTGLTRCEL